MDEQQVSEKAAYRRLSETDSGINKTPDEDGIFGRIKICKHSPEPNRSTAQHFWTIECENSSNNLGSE